MKAPLALVVLISSILCATPLLATPLATPRPTAAKTHQIASDLAAPKAIVQRAKRHLTRQLHINPKTLTLVSATVMDWPDSCLGLGKPNKFCKTIVVPGWRIELEDAEQQSWVYRTNKRGDLIALETAINSGPTSTNSLPQGVRFQALTTGGIAGVQMQIQLMNDGRIMQQDLRQPNVPAKELRRVSPQAIAEFEQTLQQHHIDRYYGKDYRNDRGADMFGHTLTTRQGSVGFEDQAQMPEDMKAINQAWSMMVDAP
jgi:hypothetical protein